MTPLELEFIVQTMGSESKQFYYFRDKYALQLLQYHVKESTKISALKKSGLKGLLEKTIIRDILSKSGNGAVSQATFSEPVVEDGRVFNYTLDKWGEYVPHRNDDWYQTTRPGYNLVLQLNFDAWHNYQYCEWIKKDGDRNPFSFSCHPIAKQNNHTMSWCRIDLDLDTGEALIEEIQNDWLREVLFLRSQLAEQLEKREGQRSKHWFFSRYPIEESRKYIEAMSFYLGIWEEATLSLAIHFIRTELGLNTIYYHDFDCGNYLKQIVGSHPPRSLYTRLPKKFGFEKTAETPEFLKKEQYLKKKLKQRDLSWWVLNL